MQTIYSCWTKIRRAIGAGTVLASSTVLAQEPAGAASGGWLSPLMLGLIIAIGVLLLLLVLCVLVAKSFHKKVLQFSAKCSLLEPALEKTGKDLSDMTARFKEESELHERLIDDAGAAVFQLSHKGECIYVNSAMESLCGFSKSRILKDGLLAMVHPDDREKVSEELAGFAERETAYESSYRLLRDDGRVVHVTSRGSTFRDKNNMVLGYFGLLMDVDKWERRCNEIQRAERRSHNFIQHTVRGFYELQLDEPVLLTLPADQIAEKILNRSKLVGCTGEVARLYGKPVEELKGSYLKEIPGGCGILEHADSIQQFVTGGFRSVNVEMVRDDYRGTPVYLKNDVVGMVEDGRLVSIWGAMQDISAQKREKEQLEQRAAFFRRILDTLPGEISVKDPRCRYLYISHGIEERTGIPADDWMEKTVFEVMPAASRDFNKTSIQVMKSGKLCRTVTPRPGSDGKEWIETLENPLVSEDGVIEGVVGISVDVTEQTLREQALQRSETRFRYLVEHNPAGIMLADAKTKAMAYANPAFCDLFGYTAEEVGDLKVGDLHSPGSRKQVMADWDERARNAERFEQILPCQRKDRSMIYTDVGVSRGELEGVDMEVGVYSDASGRKQVEAGLERQRDIQAGLLRNASVLVVDVDSFGVIRSANDTLLELIGRDQEALVGKPYMDALVCEEDRPLLKHAFANSGSNVQKDYEYRLMAANGTLYTVACRVRTWADPSGETDGFTISGIDVTQQRVLEAQLREQCDDLGGRLADREKSLTAAQAANDESEHKRAALSSELHQLEATMADREKRYEEDVAAREEREADLSEQVSGLQGRKAELEEQLTSREAELENEAEQRRQAEATMADRKKQYEEDVAAREAREADLKEQVSGLQSRKAELEEQLATREAELENEVEQRRQAEELLQKTRDEFAAEREAYESETGQKIEQLEQDLKQVREREDGLVTECARLSGDLAKVEKELTTSTQELETRSAEWEAKEKGFKKTRRELEERVDQLTRDLTQSTDLRERLEEELSLSSKEAAASRETFHVQIDQQTTALKKELKEAKAQEEKLQAEYDKTVHKLTELEQTLGVRTEELKTEAAARKEEEKAYQMERKELTALIEEEKEKLAKQADEAKGEQAQSRKAEQTWTRDRKTLEGKIQKLEKTIEEQARKLEESAEERIKLERDLKESREEAAAGRESVQVQIQKKTESLKARVEELEQLEAALKTSQSELQRKLAKLEEELADRTKALKTETSARKADAKEFQSAKLQLEEAVVEEKKKLVEEVKQFNEVKAQARNTETALRRKEAALQQNIEQLEARLEERTKELAEAADQRVDLERQLEESREEAARERDTVQKQIDDKTKELQQKIAAQQAHEEELKAEQDELNSRLAKLRETLEERVKQIESLQKTRQELEEMVQQEKDNLAQRIQLFKEETAEFNKAEAGWKKEEGELQKKIEHVEAVLDRRMKELDTQTSGRQKAEKEIERLKKALEAGHQVIYDFSDDLAEPLKVVLELPPVIQNEVELPEEAYENLAEIHQSAQRLQAVIDYRLELTNLEAGTTHCDAGSLDVDEFIKEMTGEFTDKAEAKKLFFAMSRGGDLHGDVSTDGAKVRQILTDLFTHALDCTTKGQMGLHAMCEEGENGKGRLVFQLMYSGLDNDEAVTGGLFDESGKEKVCSEMSTKELQLDLLRRQAELLGGGLSLESRGRKPLLSFMVPVDHQAAGKPAKESSGEAPAESAEEADHKEMAHAG